MTPVAAPETRRRLPWGTIGRVVLLIGGIIAIAILVRNAGPAKVAAVLRDAWIFFPVLVACEIAMVACDVSCVRWQIGPERTKIPFRSWIHSSTFAYALQILFPAGRPAGEIARGSVLGRHVGYPRAIAASVAYQCSNLYAVATLSINTAVLSYAYMGPAAGSLPKFALLNAAIVFFFGTFFGRMLRSTRAADFIMKRFKLDEASKDDLRVAVKHHSVPRGALFCMVGRTIQLGQYGIAVLAIGGKFGLVPAAVAHGIQLFGATIGDLIPNQLGAVEGTYSAFSDVMQLTPERVLALPLLIRITQISLATTCLVIASSMGKRKQPDAG